MYQDAFVSLLFHFSFGVLFIGIGRTLVIRDYKKREREKERTQRKMRSQTNKFSSRKRVGVIAGTGYPVIRLTNKLVAAVRQQACRIIKLCRLVWV